MSEIITHWPSASGSYRNSGVCAGFQELVTFHGSLTLDAMPKHYMSKISPSNEINFTLSIDTEQYDTMHTRSAMNSLRMMKLDLV